MRCKVYSLIEQETLEKFISIKLQINVILPINMTYIFKALSTRLLFYR